MSKDFEYPPSGNQFQERSSCVFYPKRICIEFLKGDDRPCEICDITVMWWKEKMKELKNRDDKNE